jgi:hypothetical protein
MGAALGLASNKDAMGALAAAFGPALPADTAFSQVAVSNPALAGLVRSSSHDEGHAGRFSVPGAEGTVSMQDVLAQRDPGAFIQKNLSWGNTGEVLTVFVPGLNTPEAESERRLEKQYSPVLGDRRMAHLHLGSATDQGDVHFTVDPSLVGPLQAQLQTLGKGGIAPTLRTEGGRTFATLNAAQRDRAEAALVAAGLIVTQTMVSVKDLLKAQLEGPGGPRKLDLMLYSRGSIDGAAGISSWVDDFTRRHSPRLGQAGAKAEAQRLLQNVVVETYGNASRNFPDGPQYIHWSATTDPLSRDLGSTAANPRGGGKNAMFVHYDGIHPGFNAHNFGSVGAQAAKLTLELNGVSTGRELYARFAGKPFVVPTTEQLKARVEQTRGADWLW